MIGSILKTVANIALDAAALKSLQLNNSEKPRTAEERERQREQRKTISNVRNAAYLIKRLVG